MCLCVCFRFKLISLTALLVPWWCRYSGQLEGSVSLLLKKGTHTAVLQWRASGDGVRGVKEWAQLQQMIEGYAAGRTLLAMVRQLWSLALGCVSLSLSSGVWSLQFVPPCCVQVSAWNEPPVVTLPISDQNGGLNGGHPVLNEDTPAVIKGIVVSDPDLDVTPGASIQVPPTFPLPPFLPSCPPPSFPLPFLLFLPAMC